MKNILALAKITFLEGIRSRSLYGIALFSLFILGLNVAVAGFFMRDIGKVSVDMNLSALNFSGILLVFFVGLNLMTKDIDKKTIQIVLSKPVNRLEYVAGKYVGIVMFTLFSLAVLFFISCLTMMLLNQMHSQYFLNFKWFNFVLASVFVAIKFSLMVAVVVFFSSIATSSFVSLIFSVSVYIVGSVIEDVVFYLKSEIAIQEKVVSTGLEQFIGVISYLVPNFSVFDFGIEAAHGLAIQPQRLMLSVAYAIVYAAVLIFASSAIFTRREFH